MLTLISEVLNSSVYMFTQVILSFTGEWGWEGFSFFCSNSLIDLFTNEFILHSTGKKKKPKQNNENTKTNTNKQTNKK